MAQQPKQAYRVKALKQFKVSIEGALPIMAHPGDVVEVDRFLCGMLVSSLKAEITEEKLSINKAWEAPNPQPATDPSSAVVRAVEALTSALTGSKGRGIGLAAR